MKYASPPSTFFRPSWVSTVTWVPKPPEPRLAHQCTPSSAVTWIRSTGRGVCSAISSNAGSGSSGRPAAVAKSLAVPSGSRPSDGKACASPSCAARAAATSLRVPSPPAGDHGVDAVGDRDPDMPGGIAGLPGHPDVDRQATRAQRVHRLAHGVVAGGFSVEDQAPVGQ